MSDNTPMLSRLVEKAGTLTGNEPGLPRLHQLRWQEMTIDELIDLLDEKQQRLFACDCAEKALSLIDNPDPRSIDAVRIARLYIVGKATDEDRAAASEAASAAAWAAVWAARAAASEAASAAAWAARAAARAAASEAARAAASEAAKEWQKERLIAYLSGTVEPLHLVEGTYE